MGGKRLPPSLTHSGARHHVRPDRHNLYEMTELLKPLEPTAQLVGMRVLPPLLHEHLPNLPGIPVPAGAVARIDAFARRGRDRRAVPEATVVAAQA
jgi:hypothetical protein